MPRALTAAVALMPALLVATASAQAQSGARDRYFTRLPFDAWKQEGASNGIKWNTKVLPPVLTPHQRLATRVEARIDAKEVAKHKASGELVTLLEITDGEGHRWRTHEALDLARIPKDAKAQPVVYTHTLLIRPGDYQMVLAIADSQTKQHSLITRPIHIAPLRNDPLPDADRNLPPVEFVRNFEAPENWFQPNLRGRLELPLETKRRVHVDVLMNITASDRVAGSIRVFRRNMSLLVPSLKLLAGIGIKDGTLGITVIDLTRQITWEQKNARGLDWAKMREPFASTNPGVVDAQSLAGKAEMLQFFRDQLADKVTGPPDSEPMRVVIVLSTPVFLEHQYKLDAAPLPKDPNRRIFYLRYQPIPPLRYAPQNADGSINPVAVAMPGDDLEHVVKSLDGRVFNAISPAEFRRALATVLQEISRM